MTDPCEVRITGLERADGDRVRFTLEREDGSVSVEEFDTADACWEFIMALADLDSVERAMWSAICHRARRIYSDLRELSTEMFLMGVEDECGFAFGEFDEVDFQRVIDGMGNLAWLARMNANAHTSGNIDDPSGLLPASILDGRDMHSPAVGRLLYERRQMRKVKE